MGNLCACLPEGNAKPFVTRHANELCDTLRPHRKVQNAHVELTGCLQIKRVVSSSRCIALISYSSLYRSEEILRKTKSSAANVNAPSARGQTPLGRPTNAPQVAILLALFNGARYLDDQLESLHRQTYPNWSLIVSDDGSTDSGVTKTIDFARRNRGRPIRIIEGPGDGFQANFLHLLGVAGPAVPFVAFSDQDDSWMPNKLDRAIHCLSELPDGQPGLFCSRTIYTDSALRPIGPSPLFKQAPSFGNALVQSIAGGNTMVLNRAAVSLLQKTIGRIGPVPSHDWWTYLMVTGAGGQVIYDPEPHVLYRQHTSNIVGSNQGSLARMRRVRGLLSGRLRTWSAQNISALHEVRHLLTDEARDQLDTFAMARHGPLYKRVHGFRSAGVYRQTKAGALGLWIAAILGKI